MKIATILLTFVIPLKSFADDCGSSLQYFSLKDVTPHTYYMRVHPTGDFLLLSGEKAVIIDFRDKNHPQEIQTFMNKEAYPVEASNDWKWIASPNHEEKMRYYDFRDLLANGQNSKPVYEDAGLNQFYHSSAELPGSGKNKIHFRTSIWSLLKYRDYTAYFDGGALVPKKVEKTETHSLCPNLKKVGFRQPILSKDGTEIAGLTKDKNGNETTTVYKIEKDRCVLDYNIGFNTGKVSFSYPKPGLKPMITFTATIANKGPNDSVSRTMRSGVWVYDPNKKQNFPISPASQAFSVTYPGFTQDGRVFYLTSRGPDFGVTVADAPHLMATPCQ